MGRTLENAVQFGWPLLFEDADEIIDPQFDTILEKNIEIQAGAEMIKIGDQMREYNKNFKFFITTKLSRPHYAPEVCVKVTMLNFMVTEEGLMDQMLSLVVKSEDNKRYEQSKNCIQQEAENNVKIA